MFFELYNVSIFWQNFINDIFRKHLNDFYIVYVNDIFIYNKIKKNCKTLTLSKFWQRFF